MKNHLTKRDRKELNHLRSISSSTSDLSRQRKTLLNAIESGEAERTGVQTSKICLNQYDKQGKLTKRRKIGFLQREEGMREGRKFYFNRGYKVNGMFYPVEGLFCLDDSSREYSYLEKS